MDSKILPPAPKALKMCKESINLQYKNKFH